MTITTTLGCGEGDFPQPEAISRRKQIPRASLGRPVSLVRHPFFFIAGSTVLH
jgi:hypothetical protein